MGDNQYEPQLIEKDDLQIQRSIKTSVPEHEVLISCNSDHQGILMSEWLEVEGFDAFIKWYDNLPDVRREAW